MPGPWNDSKGSGGNQRPRPGNRIQARLSAIPPRRRYLILTFAFIALVTTLLLAGQFTLLAILLLVCLIYAPRIVEWVMPGGGGNFE